MFRCYYGFLNVSVVHFSDLQNSPLLYLTNRLHMKQKFKFGFLFYCIDFVHREIEGLNKHRRDIKCKINNFQKKKKKKKKKKTRRKYDILCVVDEKNFTTILIFFLC